MFACPDTVQITYFQGQVKERNKKIHKAGLIFCTTSFISSHFFEKPALQQTLQEPVDTGRCHHQEKEWRMSLPEMSCVSVKVTEDSYLP